MATKEGYYGSDDTSNTFMGNGTNWFTLVDKKLGDIDLYEKELIDDKKAATIFAESGKLDFNPNWFSQDLKHKDWINNNQNLVKNAASDTAKNGIKEEKNISSEAASNEAKKLTKSNKALSQAEIAEASRPTTIGPEKIGPPSPGTKEGGFGNHVFPSSLRTNRGGQDFMKIDMMKFQPSKLKGSSGGIGGGGHLGIVDRKSDRKSIGSVILPIPGGVRDNQQVSWNQDTINPLQLAVANIALNSIEKNFGEGVKTASAAVQEALKDQGTKTALGAYFAGQAAQAQNLLTRTTGAIMNPNMELLFSAPGMRNFSFAFTLAPRNQNEAMTIIKIIRFFKQGMAPIRSKSRLFLKSPHTFRLAYKRNGHMDDGIGIKDHPYLNKFKECALNTFSVDYTPNANYSTYEDGVMTSYQITMNFQELNPIYNDDYGDVPRGGLPAEIGF